MAETTERIEKVLSGAKPGGGPEGDRPAGNRPAEDRPGEEPRAGAGDDADAILQARDRMLRSAAVVGEQIVGFAAARLRRSEDLLYATGTEDGGDPVAPPVYASAAAHRSFEDAQRLAELAARIMMMSCAMQTAGRAHAAARTAPFSAGPAKTNAAGASGETGPSGDSAREPWSHPAGAGRISLADRIRPPSHGVLRKRRGITPKRAVGSAGARTGSP